MARLKLALTLLMLGSLGWLSFKFLDARTMAMMFRSLDFVELLVLAVLPLGFLLPRAHRFSLLLAPRSRKRWRVALYAYCASQAVSMLPGGIAGRAAVMKSAGLPFKRNLLPVLADSYFDQTFLAATTLAVAFFVPAYRSASFLAVPILVCSVALVLLPPLRRGFKRLTFARAKQMGRLKVWKSFRHSFLRMWSPGRMLACAMLTVLANVANFFALCWIIGAFGLTAPPAAILMALLVPNLLGRLSLLPGGAGIVETGMVAILVTAGRLAPSEAAAVTVLFRITDVLLPALYGLLLYLLMPVRSSDAQTVVKDPNYGSGRWALANSSTSPRVSIQNSR